MSSVEQSWQRIKAWISANAEQYVERFPEGASAESLAAAEEKMGLQLPGDLRASYLLQDGRDYGEQELNILPTSEKAFDNMPFCLLQLDRVADEWDVWRDLIDGGDFEGESGDPAPGITTAWWSKQWIPVAGNGGGDFVCVDMGPAEGGRQGQVILAWHDDESRELLAPSWSDYLEQLAEGMEAGKFKFDEVEGVVRAD